MSDTTTRRDILLAGLAVTAAGVTSAQAQTPARFRIAVTGDYENVALKSAPWNTLGDGVEVVSFTKPFRSLQETVTALRDFDALAMMRERTPMPREALEKLPRLKLIVFSGLMNETLDHPAAAARNIIVCRSLGMGGNDARPATQGGGGSPSEQALALMLACAKHIPAADTLIRQGGWALEPNIPLRGKPAAGPFHFCPMVKSCLAAGAMIIGSTTAQSPFVCCPTAPPTLLSALVSAAWHSSTAIIN